MEGLTKLLGLKISGAGEDTVFDAMKDMLVLLVKAPREHSQPFVDIYKLLYNKAKAEYKPERLAGYPSPDKL